MAWAGGHREPTPPRRVTGRSCGALFVDKLISRPLFLCKKEDINATQKGTHFDVVGTAVHGREDELDRIMKITTGSEFAPPSSANAPLLPCPCCPGCLVERRPGTARAMANSLCRFLVVSSAAASLCNVRTADASAGNQWTSGRPSESDSSNNCPL